MPLEFSVTEQANQFELTKGEAAVLLYFPEFLKQNHIDERFVQLQTYQSGHYGTSIASVEASNLHFA